MKLTRYRAPLLAAISVASLLAVAQAWGEGEDGAGGPEQRRRKVLDALPSKQDVLINLDPEDLPATSDMVRLGRAATPAIVNGLVNSMSPRVRTACASVLTATRDPAAIDALMDALDDPEDFVRCLAMDALGSVETRKPTPRLLSAVKRPGVAAFVKETAVRSLGRAGDPAAAGPLLDYFRRTWDPAAQQALWDMREILGPDRLAAIVVPPLSAPADRAAPPEVLSFAVERAGDLKLRDAVGPLERLFDLDEGLQNRIVYNLGRIGDPSAAPFLEKLFDRTADARLLNNVAFALDRLGRDVKPLLREALKDRRAYIRFNAAFVAGDLALKDLVADLAAGLKDANDFVRGEVAVALGKIGSPAALPALEEASREWNPVVRRDALISLATIDYAKYRDRVVQELLSSERASIRGKAVRFLAQSNDGRIVAPVLAALDPDDYSDQDLGIAFLGGFDTLDDPNATAFLLRLAGGSGHRHGALRLLGRFADPAVRPLLRQWLNSPCGEQDQMMRALGRLGDKESAELARAWLARTDPSGVVHAAFLLASTGEKEGLDRLLAALENAPSEIKQAAAVLLSELGPERLDAASDTLVKMLDHEDVYVRLNAARVLASRNDARGFERLKKELDKRMPFIRDEVLDVVERAPRAYSEPFIKAWLKKAGPLLRRDLERILEEG